MSNGRTKVGAGAKPELGRARAPKHDAYVPSCRTKGTGGPAPPAPHKQSLSRGCDAEAQGDEARYVEGRYFLGMSLSVMCPLQGAECESARGRGSISRAHMHSVCCRESLMLDELWVRWSLLDSIERCLSHTGTCWDAAWDVPTAAGMVRAAQNPRTCWGYRDP